MAKKKSNVYEMAGKVGKNVRKYGNYVLASVVPLALTQIPTIIKKIKK